MKKLLATLLAVLMLASILTASSMAEEAGALNLGMGMLNDTGTGFNPPINYGNCFESSLIWEPLLRYDVDTNSYIPILAESYTISEDGTKHTVVLKDAKFHDGEPITADDVIFTFNLNLLVGGSNSGPLKGLKGGEAVATGEAEAIEGIYAENEKTVVFEFDTPNFNFAPTLGSGCLGILPKHLLGDLPAAEVPTYADYWAKPIGSGPYKVDETAYPNYVTLTRFEDYHSAPAGIEKIHLTAYADNNAMMVAMMAGECDIGRQVDATAGQDAVASNPSLELTLMDSDYCRCFVFNLSDKEGAREDLKNPRIRQALNMIIDKQMVVDYIGISSSVATTPNVGSEYNTDVPRWQRDLEGGVKILQEEGFDFNTPLRLYAYYTDQQTIDIMDIVVANLAEAGITTELLIDGENIMSILYENCTFDLGYAAIGQNGVLPYQMVDPGAIYDSWFNDAFLASNEELFGSLIDQYNGTADATQRKQLLDQIQVNFMENMPIIPGWLYNTAWLINKDHVQGLKLYSADYNTYAYLNVADWKLVD